jgi:hypothetical protein
MSKSIMGVVKNGVILPSMALPEGARVEIHLPDGAPPLQKQSQACGSAVTGTEQVPARATCLTPAELRRMPREQRQAILAAAAELAEEDYRSDKELTGFEAFSEEELDDNESDSR